MSERSRIKKIIFCVAVMILIFAAFAVRLIQWQLVDGNKYLEDSQNYSSTSVKLSCARGEIYDCSGNALAKNELVYNLVYSYIEMDREKLNSSILNAVHILDSMSEEWKNSLPIEYKDGEYVFKADKEREIETLKSQARLKLNEESSAKDCVDSIKNVFAIKGFSEEDVFKVAAVRYTMLLSGFSSYNVYYVFAENISIETVTVVSEKADETVGLSVEVSTERNYVGGNLIPHIIGYVGALSQEEYEKLKQEGETYSSQNISGYTYSDVIGKSGIELILEQELRGETGKLVWESDENGNYKISNKSVPSINGNRVYLTIDSKIQEVANVSLANNVKEAQLNGIKTCKEEKDKGSDKITGYGEDCEAGAVVVLRVSDFSVLAMSTYPSYDLEKSLNDKEYYSEIVTSEKNPLVNRATMGSFTPGSVYKPIVALAALEENVIDSQSLYPCEGVYKNPNFIDYNPKCLGIHGEINIVEAIKISWNIFFYSTGYELGISKMEIYSKLFGLGENTGIELYESKGILAGPDEYSNYHEGAVWTDGLTVQASIGQADNSFTPLQLAVYAATIANDGERLNAHIVDKVTTYDGESVIYETESKVLAQSYIDKDNLDTVKYGMSLVCSEGGTASALSSYGIKIAGKTGTATTDKTHSDHVTFIAFAPYENPEIAVSVVLEYGSKGSYAINVAKDIFDAYFYGMTVNENGELIIPE